MAFVVVNHDETVPLSEQIKTFLTAGDDGAVAEEASAEGIASVRRNILSDFSLVAAVAADRRPAFPPPADPNVLLPPPSVKETMRVFLRIKPKTSEEQKFYDDSSGSGVDASEAGKENSLNPEDGFNVISIESDYQIAFHAPSDSHTYKNSMNGAGTLTHRYTFTKVFPPKTLQTGLFSEMVLPRLQDFLRGQNQLIFTYGATSSGKTYTIQGNRDSPGIVPRALDTIFNSIGESGSGSVNFKPFGFSGVTLCKPADVAKLRKDQRDVVALGMELVGANESNGSSHSQVSEMSLQSLATMFPNLKNRKRETASCSDCLSGDDDRIKYSVWVSFAEIYNENIHDLLEKIPEPKHKGDKSRRFPLKLAEDRGGAVYIRGLKELPVSSADEAYQLLMIGRQNLRFAATRLNHHSSRSHCIFTVKLIRAADVDEPKLARTSMLSFCDLAGSERIKKTLNTGERQKEAGNINTSLLVLGRVIKALRQNQVTKDVRKHQLVPFRDSKLTRLFQSYFTGRGKASMVVNISQSPYLFDESLHVLKFSAIASKVTVEEPKPEPKKCDKRKTRFSILVENKILNGRGSIAWEKPSISSTMVKDKEEEFPGFGKIREEDDDGGDEEAEETIMEQTVIDQRYDGLLGVIKNLENQLISEKEKSLGLEKQMEKVEQEVRNELSEEFNQLMVNVQQNYEQRLQEEKERARDNQAWRMMKLREAYSQKRKRTKLEDVEDDDKVKVRELEGILKQKSEDLEHANSKAKALQDVHKSFTEELTKLREDFSKQEFNLSAEKLRVEELKAEVSSLKDELSATNAALEAQMSEPKIVELQKQLEEKKGECEKKTKECEEYVILLNEAGEEYTEKLNEVNKLKDAVVSLKKEKTEGELRSQDLTTQIDELRVLLNEANTRAEEKELQMFEMEEKMENLTAGNDLAKWTEKKAMDQQLSELNDEIEVMKEEKRKLNNQLSTLNAKDEEISQLEKEIKGLMTTTRHQNEKHQELQSTITMMKKQLSHKESAIKSLENQLSASKKKGEEFDVLRAQFEVKKQEKTELTEKVEKLRSEIVDKEYDAKRAREERETLMNHYEKLLKDKISELSLEKRESIKIREAMAKVTPSKMPQKSSVDPTEIAVLREELKKKSELIKHLESQIPSPLSSGSEELKKQNFKLSKEIERLKESHLREMEKVGKAHERIIKEYKEANVELQRHFPATDKNDDSLINSTPSNHKRSGRRGRGRRGRQNNSQASFDDTTIEVLSNASNIENKDPESTPGSTKKRRPKRGSRVKRNNRPSVTVKTANSSCGEEDKDPLSPVQENAAAAAAVGSKTPVNNGRKKLFTNTPGVEVFSPPEFKKEEQTPRSIVTRQLRSRRSRKPQ